MGTAYKSCKVATDLQMPGARDYIERHIVDYLGPKGGGGVSSFGKLRHSKAVMCMGELKKSHTHISRQDVCSKKARKSLELLPQNDP